LKREDPIFTVRVTREIGHPGSDRGRSNLTEYNLAKEIDEIRGENRSVLAAFVYLLSQLR